MLPHVKLGLQIVQVLSSLLLIAVVMMHSAKGEGLGAIGASAKVFGSQKGVEEGLNRVTTWTAIVWVGSGLILAYFVYQMKV